MAGRVLQDGYGHRIVEVAERYDRWCYAVVPIERLVAAFDSSYEGKVMLLRTSDDGQSQFSLSFEDFNTLVASYQAFLADEEARRAVPPADPFEGELPDDCPF